MSERPLSIIQGPPLAEEEGLGELTLSGWFRTICENGGAREALVFYDGGFANGTRVSWTYADLWARANEVARALIACGVGKGTRDIDDQPARISGRDLWYRAGRRRRDDIEYVFDASRAGSSGCCVGHIGFVDGAADPEKGFCGYFD